MHKFLQVVVFALSFCFSISALAQPWTITGYVSGSGGNVVGNDVQVLDSSGNLSTSGAVPNNGEDTLCIFSD